MIIANPLYDSVFKHMMENKAIAQFFIETLINQKIDRLEVSPQEYTRDIKHRVGTEDRVYLVSLYRLDFNAIIKTEDGKYKNVLIEIQKASNLDDLIRFRNYLGDQYKRTHEVPIETVDDFGVPSIQYIQEPLPIITIYMLGFKLKEIDRAVLKIKRSFIDLITQEEVWINCDFVNKLTHETYVVQIPRIDSKMQTSLERLLSVFEQNDFACDNKTLLNYHYILDKNDPVAPIVQLLERVGSSVEERKELDNESEALRSIEAMIAASNKKKSDTIAEQAQELEEKEKALAKKDQVLAEKEQVLAEKDQVLAEKDQVLAEKDQVLAEQAQALEREKESKRVIENALAEQAQELQKMKKALEAITVNNKKSNNED